MLLLPSSFRKAITLPVIVFSFLFLVPQMSIAQDSLYLKRIICDLSAPEMFGRGTPYQGDLKAAIL